MIFICTKVIVAIFKWIWYLKQVGRQSHQIYGVKSVGLSFVQLNLKIMIFVTILKITIFVTM